MSSNKYAKKDPKRNSHLGDKFHKKSKLTEPEPSLPETKIEHKWIDKIELVYTPFSSNGHLSYSQILTFNDKTQLKVRLLDLIRQSQNGNPISLIGAKIEVTSKLQFPLGCPCGYYPVEIGEVVE